MNVHSQLLDDIRPIGPEANDRVCRAHDRLGQHRLVRKRFEPANDVEREELRQQLALTRTLAGSGFLDIDDIVSISSSSVEATYAYVELARITEVYAQGGWNAVVGVLRSVSQSVAYLHALDYLHGDLKPANILLARTSNGIVPLIVDLELSLRIGVQLQRHIQGTRGFMAPEVHDGGVLTEATDAFAFGQTIRSYITELDAHPAPDMLTALADRCTRAAPGDRPASMWRVFAELDAQYTASAGTRAARLLPPPLRPAGLPHRINRLQRMLTPVDARRPGLSVVTAQPGGGVTRLLRESCFELQWRGATTLRITEVSALENLADRLADWVSAVRDGRELDDATPVYVFADTRPDCTIGREALIALDTLARRQAAPLVLGTHGVPSLEFHPNIPHYAIPSLTARECIIASGHLASNPTVASMNETMLPVGTAGNPALVQLFMQRSVDVNLRRKLPEPVNFDDCTPGITNYWHARFVALSESAQDILCTASVFHRHIPITLLTELVSREMLDERELVDLETGGWLRRLPDNDNLWEFSCRSARNSARRELGGERARAVAERVITGDAARYDLGELEYAGHWAMCVMCGAMPDDRTLANLRSGPGTIQDLKLVLWTMLQRYRRWDHASPDERAALAVDIATGYASMGSAHRQRHWCNRALAIYRKGGEGIAERADIVATLCQLYDLTGRLDEKRTWLEGMRATVTNHNGHVRGLVLSELAAVLLLKLDGVGACELAFEAHHLLEREAPGSEAHLRNLNRLGLALSHTGRLEAATKYLEQARSQARAAGFDHIEWRCTGNLGYVARAMGDPARANRYVRGITNYFRIANEKLAYMLGLRDQVMCLVELGRLHSATRTAELAAALARMVDGELEHAKALNNLGWVLAARGVAREAHAHLRSAIRLLEHRSGHEAAAWPRINLAWLYLSAQQADRAEVICREAIGAMTSSSAGTVYVEAQRVLALAAILRDDFDAAEGYLEDVTRTTPMLTPKAAAEIDVISLAVWLWRGETDAAGRLLNELEARAAVQQVHPLRLDLGRHAAHYYMLTGDYDRAQTTLSRTAEACRKSSRYDKTIDTIMMLAALANAMQNHHMAVRFTSIAQEMVDRLRGDLP